MTENVTERLRKLKKRSGLPMTTLAKKAGYKAASGIQRYFDPDQFTKEYLGFEIAKRFADALVGRGDPPITRQEVLTLAGPAAGTPLDGQNLAEFATQTQPIVVQGDVQAGVWREALEWDRGDQYVIHAPLEHPNSDKAFGLLVRGESMNEVFPSGTILICVDIYDLDVGLMSGDYVICYRQRPDELTEATVKELIVDDNGQAWLWPRSNHPKHQEPVEIPWPYQADPSDVGGETIKVAAVVISDYRARRRL